jgi:hypothetical protein
MKCNHAWELFPIWLFDWFQMCDTKTLWSLNFGPSQFRCHARDLKSRVWTLRQALGKILLLEMGVGEKIPEDFRGRLIKSIQIAIIYIQTDNSSSWQFTTSDQLWLVLREANHRSYSNSGDRDHGSPLDSPPFLYPLYNIYVWPDTWNRDIIVSLTFNWLHWIADLMQILLPKPERGMVRLSRMPYCALTAHDCPEIVNTETPPKTANIYNDGPTQQTIPRSGSQHQIHDSRPDMQKSSRQL